MFRRQPWFNYARSAIRGRNGVPPKRFLVLSMARSGSTMLVTLLNSIPGVFCDGELLSRRRLWPHAFVRGRASNRATNVYGFKLLMYQAQQVHARHDTLQLIRGFLDDGFRPILLTRVNVLAQALSNQRAMDSGEYHMKREQKRKGPFEANIRMLLWTMNAMMERAELAKKAVEPYDRLELVYEHDLLDEQNIQPTMNRTCDFLGVERAEANTALKKISPARLEALVTNPQAVRAALQNTSFEKFLEMM